MPRYNNPSAMLAIARSWRKAKTGKVYPWGDHLGAFLEGALCAARITGDTSLAGDIGAAIADLETRGLPALEEFISMKQEPAR